MPYLESNKRGAGPKVVARDYRIPRAFDPDTEAMSKVVCTVCRFRLVQLLVDAGETTHPTCSGWPPRTPARLRRTRLDGRLG